MVSHAGSGTFLAALAAGLPQVVLPLAADQFVNAAAGVAAGAAIRVDSGAFEAAAVWGALLRLLGDPSYAPAAARVQDEIRAMPAPDHVVAELERRLGPENEATIGKHTAYRSPASAYRRTRRLAVAIDAGGRRR